MSRKDAPPARQNQQPAQANQPRFRDERPVRTEPLMVQAKRSNERTTDNRIDNKTPQPIHDLESRTRDELMKIARERKIPGRDDMTREELLQSIQGQQ